MESVSLTLRCRGRWPEIMAQLAPHVDLLKAIERGSRRQGWCPVHRGKNGDAFRVFKDFTETGGAVCNTCGKFSTGFRLLMWINGWDEVCTGRELRRILEGERVSAPPPTPRLAAPVAPSEKETTRPSQDQLRRLWEEALPLAHPNAAPVRRYFASRGLGALELGSLTTLRCHPRLMYFDFKERRRVGYFPALLAQVVDPAEELVALHRTYLTEDGQKAPVRPVKKLLTAANCTARGGALRLHPAGAILCTCEGIENGLTTLLKNRLPLWPALSSALLGELVVPAQVRHLVIWGDYEPPRQQPDGSWRQPGLDAANKLAKRVRAQGCTVEMLFPKKESGTEKIDWNQVLLDHGLDAIPALSTRIQMLPTAYRLQQLRHGVVIRG